MEREIADRRKRDYEEVEDQDVEASWKREQEESWKREQGWKWEQEGSREMKDLDTEYHHKDLCQRFITGLDYKGSSTSNLLFCAPVVKNAVSYNRSCGEGMAQSTGRTTGDQAVDSLEKTIYLARRILSEGSSLVYLKVRGKVREGVERGGGKE